MDDWSAVFLLKNTDYGPCFEEVMPEDRNIMSHMECFQWPWREK